VIARLLSNLYLDGFDRAMLASGYRVVRYSDDMAIPAPDRAAAEIGLTRAAEALSDLRLVEAPQAFLTSASSARSDWRARTTRNSCL